MTSPGLHVPEIVVQVSRLMGNAFMVINSEWNVCSTRLPVNSVTRPKLVNNRVIGRQGCKNTSGMYGRIWRERIEPQVLTLKTHLTPLVLSLLPTTLLPIVPTYPILERLENLNMKISNWKFYGKAHKFHAISLLTLTNSLFVCRKEDLSPTILIRAD